MAIGEMITAARGGNVIAVEEQYVDYDLTPGHENFVFIDHGDCTYSFYAHLTQFGALVDVGDAVDAGQDIGLSGHTGNSSWPHLHFQVGLLGGDNCDRITGQTIATTFRNTRPHPDGLQDGERYEALDPAALD
jgi:murein DD-endopeptidase MepM/ murein hydrolase activator NlpD